MRINEIVTESISLTKYAPQVIGAIKNSIIGVISQFDKIPFSKEEQDTIAQKATTTPMTNRATEVVQQLFTIMPKKLEEIGKEIGIPVTVSFEEMQANGDCNEFDIGLNRRYLDGIIKHIIQTVANYTIDNASSENELLDSFKRSSVDLAKMIARGKFDDLDGIIHRCASTFIHELVHARQNKAQRDIGRTSTEYRSYLAPKEKFHQLMNRQGQSDTDEDYKIYRASPQEMAAFAHQDALQFIHDYDIDATIVNWSNEQLLEVLSGLQDYVSKYFKDRTNPKEYRLFKRYARLVYQEVIRYISHLRKPPVQPS